jgi:DNA-binding CsgD family transcriptional regulator
VTQVFPPPSPPDEIEADLVSRLTSKERECLRRWLNHETAKQIALALEISHHAVEKRLKSARSKLGVGTSIEAAQMLAHVEGYGQPVSRSPDLSIEKNDRQTKRSNSLKIGALVMTILLAALATVTMQANLTATPVNEGVSIEADAVMVDESGQVEALSIFRLSGKGAGQDAPTEEELVEYLDRQFRKFDRDGSGSIEVTEVPNAVAVDKEGKPIIVHDDRARTEFLNRHDQNSDSTVSFAEFVETSLTNYHSGVGILEVLQVRTFLK